MCSWLTPGRGTGPAGTLEVTFCLHSVTGETSSPSCICLEHLIYLESSCWDKDNSPVFIHFFREVFGWC